MTTAAKSKQGELNLPGKGEHYEQKTVDGTKIAKETTPKAIQEAGDYWLGKKYAAATAKQTADDAAEEFLKTLEKFERTSVVIFDTEKNEKRRINIISGADRLKVEKAGINE